MCIDREGKKKGRGFRLFGLGLFYRTHVIDSIARNDTTSFVRKIAALPLALVCLLPLASYSLKATYAKRYHLKTLVDPKSTQHHTSANSVIGSKHRTAQAGGGGVLGDPKAVTSSHNCLPPLALTAPSDSTTTSVVTSSVGKYFTDND